ncbi:hypothetical protein LXL04_003438 [Taraxacum kok-saghyz]
MYEVVSWLYGEDVATEESMVGAFTDLEAGAIVVTPLEDGPRGTQSTTWTPMDRVDPNLVERRSSLVPNVWATSSSAELDRCGPHKFSNKYHGVY